MTLCLPRQSSISMHASLPMCKWIYEVKGHRKLSEYSQIQQCSVLHCLVHSIPRDLKRSSMSLRAFCIPMSLTTSQSSLDAHCDFDKALLHHARAFECLAAPHAPPICYQPTRKRHLPKPCICDPLKQVLGFRPLHPSADCPSV